MGLFDSFRRSQLKNDALDAMAERSLRDPPAVGDQTPLVLAVMGPAHAGKTTLLHRLHGGLTTPKGKLVSALPRSPELTRQMHESGDVGRHLFFDLQFKPDLPAVRIATVPGQAFYSAARHELLDVADAILFMADAQPERADANEETFRDMMQHLDSTGRSLAEVPWALQVNKLDLTGEGGLEPAIVSLPLVGLRDSGVEIRGTFSEQDIPTFGGALLHVAKLALGELRRGKPARLAQ